MSVTEGNLEDGGKAEDLGPEACCAPGCSCSSGPFRGGMRVAVGVVILVVAGVLVARAVIKSNGIEEEPAAPEFASATAQTDGVVPSGGSASAADTANMAAPASGLAPGAKSPVVTTIAGTEIGALSELNELAAETDAVFVYLPGQKEGADKIAPTGPLDGAVRTLKEQGVKAEIFTLSAGGPDYTELAAQMDVPGVLAVVKGRGMVPVTGEITKPKLIQGFVAASSAGGCSPSAGSACCP